MDVMPVVPIVLFFVFSLVLMLAIFCYQWRNGFMFPLWLRVRPEPVSNVGSPPTVVHLISPTVTVYRRITPESHPTGTPVPTGGPAPYPTGAPNSTASYPHPMPYANSDVCPPSYDQVMRTNKNPRYNPNAP